MLHIVRQRRREDEQGFTLIELMVVVLIIAILIAIAIPTFLGARSRAQNRAAQSDLRNALTAEKTVYTDNQTYDAYNNGSLTSAEPSLSFMSAGAAASASANQVAVSVVGTNTGGVCLITQSASGTYYGIVDVQSGDNGQFNTPGTFYAKGSSLSCPSTIPTAGWSSTTSAAGW